MITKFNIYESVRDKMTPISKDDILSKFASAEPEKMFDISFKHNMVDLLKVALDKGVNPDYETDRGTPYLCLACANGMYEFVEILLQRGANVNIRGRRDRTPLIEAVTEGHKDVAELLLKNKADVNLQDVGGETALMYSVSVDMTKLLLKYGADKDIKSKYGRTSLEYARELNRYDVFNYLRSPNVNEGIRDKMTPISKEKLNDVVLRKINKKELGYFNPLDWGLTLLDYDGTGGLNDHHVVKFVSQDGRKWEMTLDERSRYPIMVREMKRGIMYRVAFNYAEVEKYLRKRGLEKIVNESVRDKMTPKSEEEIEDALNGKTPMELFREGDWDDNEWLIIKAIDKGLDLNFNNKEPLKAIIRQNCVDTVKYLLEKGVDLNPSLGFDPFYIAAFNGHVRIIKLLIKYKVKLDRDVTKVAIIHDHINAAVLLSDYYEKQKVNEGVRDMMTPKSKEEIEEELEDLEPGERMRTIFNQQMEDISNGIEPYYTQEQIDNMIPDYINICDFIFDIYEKIDDLYYLYNLSVLIRQELKRSLQILPASEQIQYVHDLEYLGGLYTDKEWADLGVRAKQEREKKKVNEGVRDKMTPKSEEQIEEELKKMSSDEKLKYGCDKGMLWLVERAFKEDEDVIKRNPNVLTTVTYKNYPDIVDFLLKNNIDIHGGHDQPILISSSEGYTEILRMLLKAGANPDTPNGQPLVISALNGHLENVKLLLSFGAEMEWADSYIIQTVGIQDNNEEVMNFLLDYKKRGVIKKLKDYTKHKFDV